MVTYVFGVCLGCDFSSRRGLFRWRWRSVWVVALARLPSGGLLVLQRNEFARPSSLSSLYNRWHTLSSVLSFKILFFCSGSLSALFGGIKRQTAWSYSNWTKGQSNFRTSSSRQYSHQVLFLPFESQKPGFQVEPLGLEPAGYLVPSERRGYRGCGNRAQ